MAGLVKWYAYPTLAKVPVDQSSVSKSFGSGMTYFDKGSLSEKTDDLTTTIRIVGDVEAAQKQGHNVVVWDKSSMTTNSAGGLLAVDTQRIAFDATTALATDCCGTKSGEDPTVYKGLLVKFPMNTQKTTYQWWDDSLKATTPMKFDKVDNIGGLTVYKFTNEIPKTKVGTIDVPSGVLGEKEGQGLLTADMMYSNMREYWAEPETGALVKVLEHPDTTVAYNGTDRFTATKGVSGFPDDAIAKNVKDYKALGGQLHLVRVTLPIVGLIAGLLSLIAGLLVVMTTLRRDDAEI